MLMPKAWFDAGLSLDPRDYTGGQYDVDCYHDRLTASELVTLGVDGQVRRMARLLAARQPAG